MTPVDLQHISSQDQATHRRAAHITLLVLFHYILDVVPFVGGYIMLNS